MWLPGITAGGHISRGHWHPGAIEGCVKCPKPAEARSTNGDQEVKKTIHLPKVDLNGTGRKINAVDIIIELEGDRLSICGAILERPAH